MRKLDAYETEMLASPDQQISLPVYHHERARLGRRWLQCASRGSTEHHLIIELHVVTSIMGVEPLIALMRA